MSNTTDEQLLKLFKVMVVERAGSLDFSNVSEGFVTNFQPTPQQLKALKSEFKPLDLKTLFSVRERETASINDLVLKQVLHYIEIYRLNAPGLFNLEHTNGKVSTLAYVRGVSIIELGDMVRALLYANAPVRDAIALKEAIDAYRIDFDLSKIKNNEMRVLVFDVGKDTFENGDDVVRYMCYVSTESALLIKSKQVIQAIEEHGNLFQTAFLNRHTIPLAKVFHRHKNLILAAKTVENKGAINKISRLAKTLHVPVHEPLSKRYIAEAYAARVGHDVLQGMSVRDKFKFLNLLKYKELGNTMDAFIIRNGKVHLEKGRAVLDPVRVKGIVAEIIISLFEDLKHLKDKSILLDSNVDYGLPVSRKQVIGQLPFGTTVTPNGDTISAGIYWDNAGGARDLDLSAVDLKGHRVGWGQYSGYTDKDIVFSGDVTDATNGAMEFMTSKVSNKEPYALFVNIFAGEEGAKFSLVVGAKTRDKWIASPVLREAGELNSKGNILGFVKGGNFVVYACRLNSAAWSVGSKEESIVKRGLADFWTVKSLLGEMGIPYTLNKELGRNYDYDLSYQGFSLDKLEALFQAK